MHTDVDSECSLIDNGWRNRRKLQIMNMIKLFGKPVRVNKSAADRKTLDVGANLFIGALMHAPSRPIRSGDLTERIRRDVRL